MLPSLDGEDMEMLRRCQNPREVNRMVRMMLEHALVQTQLGMKH
jgi:hypothetical protein